jgi:hypothetical protein
MSFATRTFIILGIRVISLSLMRITIRFGDQVLLRILKIKFRNVSYFMRKEDGETGGWRD